ncbi:hypothetical protein F5Y18DRAFT_433577 [Xylariaceae sp. FL1019]|nr:hypothetical protein F5Y18DRAFT_433577 [Xylariaceae sp. FL1019]
MNAAFESSATMKSFRFAMTRQGQSATPPHTVQMGTPGKAIKNKSSSEADQSFFELIGDAYARGMNENEARCINDEFDLKRNATLVQCERVFKVSDGGRRGSLDDSWS